MTYTFKEHLHNYAIWIAARAIQRNYTETKNIKSTIEETELIGLYDLKEVFTVERFDNFHRDS